MAPKGPDARAKTAQKLAAKTIRVLTLRRGTDCGAQFPSGPPTFAFTSPTMVGLSGTRDASATTVHSALAAHGLSRRALLWNAFPLHPFLPGRLDKNRTPTSAEFATGDDVLRAAARGRRVIAVGGKAAMSVARATGVAVPTVQSMSSADVAVTVRHPSFGGVPEFN